MGRMGRSVGFKTTPTAVGEHNEHNPSEVCGSWGIGEERIARIKVMRNKECSLSFSCGSSFFFCPCFLRWKRGKLIHCRKPEEGKKWGHWHWMFHLGSPESASKWHRTIPADKFMFFGFCFRGHFYSPQLRMCYGLFFFLSFFVVISQKQMKVSCFFPVSFPLPRNDDQKNGDDIDDCFTESGTDLGFFWKCHVSFLQCFLILFSCCCSQIMVAFVFTWVCSSFFLSDHAKAPFSSSCRRLALFTHTQKQRRSCKTLALCMRFLLWVVIPAHLEIQHFMGKEKAWDP